MQALIQKINEYANKANLIGYTQTQAELSAWQMFLNENQITESAKLFHISAIRYLEQYFTPALKDQDMARTLRNFKNALIINAKLLSLLEPQFREKAEAIADLEKHALVEAFKQEYTALLEKTNYQQQALSLEELNNFNQKARDLLQQVYEIEEQDLPAQFVLEVPPAPTASSSDNFTAQNRKQSLFMLLTEWLKNLADPAKNIQSTMMSMIGGLVQLVVGVIARLFKPFLGANADSQINTFSHYAGKVFTRYAETVTKADQNHPTFVPSFDAMRAQRGQQQASTVTPEPTPTPTRPTSS